ncbi:MAG: MarR family transcriptional regulator [Paracoccaceae bacterium]
MTQIHDPLKKSGFVADYLLYLLAAASDSASAEFHKQVRLEGLRVPEWRVLAGLYDQDGMMVTQLAKISLTEQSRLTHIIAQMEKRGLVQRCGDPEDRRRVRVHFTDEGKRIADILVAKARKHEENLLEALQDGDSSRLKPVLRDLLKKLETWPK